VGNCNNRTTVTPESLALTVLGKRHCQHNLCCECSRPCTQVCTRYMAGRHVEGKRRLHALSDAHLMVSVAAVFATASRWCQLLASTHLAHAEPCTQGSHGTTVPCPSSAQQTSVI